jgi:hypothetical protein
MSRHGARITLVPTVEPLAGSTSILPWRIDRTAPINLVVQGAVEVIR